MTASPSPLPFSFTPATTYGQVEYFRRMLARDPKALAAVEVLVELVVGPFHTMPRSRRTA